MITANKKIFKHLIILIHLILLFLLMFNSNWNKNNLKQFNNFTSSNKCKFNHTDNEFKLWQIAYQHDNEPEAKIFRTFIKDVDFKIGTKNVYVPSSMTNINETNWINDLTQTSHFDNINNSGSYFWGDNGYDSLSRVPKWFEIIKDYISLKINNVKTFGKTNASLSFDVRNIWKKNEGIKLLKGKKVFQNQDNPSYVYDDNDQVEFIRGISKELMNKDYNVWAIPYTFMKENQYVYVVYNYTTRYVYSLQTNNLPDKQMFDTQHDNLISLKNDFVTTFDIDKMISINKIDYLNHSIYLGFNNELNLIYTNLINLFDSEEYKILSSKSISLGFNEEFKKDVEKGNLTYKNIKEFTEINSYKEYSQTLKKYADNETKEILHKYGINQSAEFIEIINTLLNNLNFNLDYSVFDELTKSYVNKQIKISFRDIASESVSINLKKDMNNEYLFKINKLSILNVNNTDLYIPESVVNFNLDYSTKNIIKKNDFFKLSIPEISKIKLFVKDKSILNFYPSEIEEDYILKNIIKIYDGNGNELNVNDYKPLKYHIKYNDIQGSIEIKLDKPLASDKLVGFKKFDINKFMILDANKYEYGLIPDEIDDSVIKKILNANGIIKNIANNLDFSIVKTDNENGIVKLKLKPKKDSSIEEMGETNIQISNFLKFYVRKINNLTILNKYKPDQITKELVIGSLLQISDGFKFKYQNSINLSLYPNNKQNTLIVKLTYGKNGILNFTYQFSNKFNIINIVCYTTLAFSLIGITSVLIHKAIKYKKNITTL